MKLSSMHNIPKNGMHGVRRKNIPKKCIIHTFVLSCSLTTCVHSIYTSTCVHDHTNLYPMYYGVPGDFHLTGLVLQETYKHIGFALT